MCLQSYYNQNNHEIELDLLAEIKQFGLTEWNRMVDEEKRKIEVKSVNLSAV